MVAGVLPEIVDKEGNTEGRGQKKEYDECYENFIDLELRRFERAFLSQPDEQLVKEDQDKDSERDQGRERKISEGNEVVLKPDKNETGEREPEKAIGYFDLSPRMRARFPVLFHHFCRLESERAYHTQNEMVKDMNKDVLRSIHSIFQSKGSLYD